MKKFLHVAVMLLVPAALLAQAQIENPGFEGAWEDVSGTEDEPAEWSSLKSADALTALAPIVAFQETVGPHSGTYCLRLLNVDVFGTIANGIATNGRIHADLDPENGYVYTDTANATWNYFFSDRPDSLVVWIKYAPAGTDTCKVEIVLHDTTEQGRNPHGGSFANWIGRARYTTGDAYAAWTRVSVPFNYWSAADPDAMLAVISAGDSTSATVDSEMWIDDFELIYNPDTSTGSFISQEKATYSIVVHDEFVRVSVDELANAEFILTNLEGKVVMTEKLVSPVTEVPVSLPTGIYAFTVRYGKQIKTGKIKL